MKDFYKALKIIEERKNQTFALATITNVEGSAYRREGAKMLIGLDKSMHGTISAGCLEEDLYYHACEVIETLQTKNVTYDLSSEDDLTWGQGAGCNGVIDVFVEPFYWDFLCYSNLIHFMEQGRNILSVKWIKGYMPFGAQIFYSQDLEVIEATEAGRNVLNQMIPYVNEFLENNSKAEVIRLPSLEGEFLFERNEPKDPLYVFGAGPDVEPLVDYASRADYAVHVIDPRGNRCTKENFPSATSIIVAYPESYLQEKLLPAHSYAVVMTHNFDRDKQILQSIVDSDLRYLGVLGPRKRTKRLIAPRELPDWVHSPIGLDIGAESPEEISISVMAELINIRSSLVSVGQMVK